MAIFTTKAAMIAATLKGFLPQRLTYKMYQYIVQLAESYSATTATDWTSLDGVSSAPTTQDGALDIVATSLKNLEANDPDTIIGAQGDLIVGNASAKGAALNIGAANSILTSNGTTATWSDSLSSVVLNDVTTTAYDTSIVSDGNGGTPLTADRTLTIDVVDGDRNIDLAGNLSIAADFTQAGAFATTITSTATTSVTLPTSAKLKGFAKATVGYAALNAAGAGVAVNAGETIPVGAYVTRAYFDVTEAFVGDVDSTATLGIGIQDQAVDIQAYAAVSGAPFDATGLEEGSVGIDGTVAKYIAIATTAKQVAVTIGALNNDSAFTSGSVDVYVEYVY